MSAVSPAAPLPPSAPAESRASLPAAPSSRPAESAAASVQLYRVDDRLIHGQVVLGWGRRLGPSRIVVVDDRIAGDAWERELLASAAPREMTPQFLSVAEAARWLANGSSEGAAILLFESPATVLRLAQEGFVVPELNLGGLHREGGREITSYLFLLPADVAALRELAARGTRIYALDLPDGRRIDASAFLN